MISIEWRAIPGYEHLYEVSSDGRVRSVPRTVTRLDGSVVHLRGVMLSSAQPRGRYEAVNLYRDRIRRHMRIHKIVALAFIGPRPNGQQVRHLNGNSRDNRLSNLEYGTPSDNNADTVRHGRHHNARKTHCPQGHELPPVTYLDDGRRRPRRCSPCVRAGRLARSVAA